jgi:hypothetical protein
LFLALSHDTKNNYWNGYLVAYFGSVLVMMIVSWVLINAVLQIRNYLQHEQYSVNTLNLVIHSVAYGFYFFPLLVSCVFYVF